MYRNDDPPTDRAAEEAEARADKIYDDLRKIHAEGTIEDFLDAIAAYIIKEVEVAYSDGYVTGASDKAIEVPGGHSEGGGT